MDKEVTILNIANFNIQIKFGKTEWPWLKKKMIDELFNYYDGFIVNEAPKKIDYKINFIDKKTLEIISRFKEKKTFINFYQEEKNGDITTFYQISISQFQLVIRDVLEKLLTKNKGFIFHASASNVKGRAYIFLGRPGAGKSTVMKLLNERFPSLADDSVIIRKENKSYSLYQTPFIEKENWVKKRHGDFPIKKIFFLRKANYFKMEKISNKDFLLKKIIQQFWTEENHLKRQIKYVMRFVAEFNNFYFLYFAKEAEGLIKLIRDDEKIQN